MTESLVLTRTDARVATLTLNRPDKLNALNQATLEALDRAVAAAGANPDVRVIVITGAGDRAFVAGADIGEIRERSAVEARHFSQQGQALMRRIQLLEKPVIAAVNGFALGGGLELALACHLRIAADTAKLGLPEIKLGIMPGFGGSQRLPRLVGSAHALEMMLTGEPVDAARAESLGLVNRVVPSAELEATVTTLATTLAAAAPEGARGILQAVTQGTETDLETGLMLETARFGLCCSTEDMKEGTSAFLEKRKATFTGR